MEYRTNRWDNDNFSTEVEVEADHVKISDSEGEIVYWDRAEWEQDPTVTTAIAHALCLLYTRGPQALRDRLQDRSGAAEREPAQSHRDPARTASLFPNTPTNNSRQLRVGSIVTFGRANGEKTRGRVVKINGKSAKVETLEARGKHAAGQVWSVALTLLRVEQP